MSGGTASADGRETSVRWGLPNVVTTLRLALAPVLAVLLLRPGIGAMAAAFAVFLAAALSDLWDGYLARRRGQITDYGKLVDPLADKLLLAAALVPFYVITTSRPSMADLPLYGHVPLWVVLVLLGREVLVTVLRTAAARIGTVVQASRTGKYKAFLQNVFVGATILWFVLRTGLSERGWDRDGWAAWETFHGWFVAVVLTTALVLTVYSMALYLVSFGRVLTADR